MEKTPSSESLNEFIEFLDTKIFDDKIEIEDLSYRGYNTEHNCDSRHISHLLTVANAIAKDPRHTLSRNGPATAYMRHDEHGVLSVLRPAVMRNTSSFNRHLSEGVVQKTNSTFEIRTTIRSIHNMHTVTSENILKDNTILLKESVIKLQYNQLRNNLPGKPQSEY